MPNFSWMQGECVGQLSGKDCPVVKNSDVPFGREEICGEHLARWDAPCFLPQPLRGRRRVRSGLVGAAPGCDIGGFCVVSGIVRLMLALTPALSPEERVGIAT